MPNQGITFRGGLNVLKRFLINGTEVTATAAELNAAADIATPGTVEASKGVVVDSNKDIASFRNLTATGNVTAGAVVANDSSLDVTGLAASVAGNGGAVALVAGRAHTNGIGGAISATAGAGSATGTGAGGTASLVAGASGGGATGNGGAVSVTAGAAASTNGDGGAAGVTGGLATGTGTGGAATLTGGASGGATGTGGAVTIASGAGAGGTSGAVSIDSGAAGGGTAGAVTIGGTVATTVTIGRSGQTVALAGNVTAPQITGSDSSLDIAGIAGAGGGAGGAVALTSGAGHTNGAGGTLTGTAGAGAGTGNGGAFAANGGASGAGATGNGGAADLNGGAAASTDGNGGAVRLTGGAGKGTGTGGAVTVATGAAEGAGGTAGSISMDTGAANTGTGGTIAIGGTNATDVAIGRLAGTVTLRGTGLTATATELNNLASVAAGTVTASKALVVGASHNLDVLGLPVGGLKIGAAGAEVVVTPTAAELNLLAGNTASAAMLNQADYDAGAHAKAVVDFNTGAAEAACSVTINAVVYLEADVEDFPNGVWTNGASQADSATSLAAAINGDTRAAVPMTAVVSTVGDSVHLLWDAVGTAGNVVISTTSAGNVTVENSVGGLAAARKRIYAVNYEVTAQDVLADEVIIPVPFAPVAWIENAKDATGLLEAHTGLVNVAHTPERIVIDNTAGGTHLAATDIVSLVVFG